MSKIVLRQCIRKIVAPPQAVPGAIKILAIEDSSDKVFLSNVITGSELEFFELQDKKDRTLCEFLASIIGQGADCTIHDATINLIPNVLYVFLVSHSSDYFIVGYSNNEWDKLFSFPSTLPNISRGNDEHGNHWTLLDSSTSGSLPVYLNGISFTRNTGSNLFVWGNVLFYSPNAGENFFWLWDYNHESNITLFTSAEDGSYAFLTDSQQVWWGHTDTAAVHYLETANEWNIGVMTSQESDSCAGSFNILSLFYDASGQLWKVIQCQNKTSTIPCIFRSKVAIRDILSHTQLIHEQTSLDDDIINTPSILDYGATSTVPKHCLKYSIIYLAPHTSHHLQHVVDVIDVPYMVNTVPVSVDFLKEYLDNQRASLSRPNTLDMSDMKDALPQYIYLKKGESYNFTVTMTLDSGHPNRKYHVVMQYRV
ncbi:Cation channel sperm-associated subunit gamma [Paramuricea clavata]|uniref:Cation channel sperm-associated subunit gamma n=2 Tax=Paramuricea clavata TaxID=317549 RepID=A0A6S7ILN3_PARCT|nr:Cation channel sperm-associated subunit gamma [Paramuricea clavata]